MERCRSSLFCFLIVAVLARAGFAQVVAAGGDNASSSGFDLESSCGDHWTYQEINGSQAMCLYYSVDGTEANFEDAMDYCSDLGGSMVQNLPDVDVIKPVQERVMALETELWIGMKKREGFGAGFYWVGGDHGTEQREATNEVPPIFLDDMNTPEKEQCIYISSFSAGWEYDDCSIKLAFVCQKAHKCPTGRFGSQCENECHCLGGAACDVIEGGGVKCPFGCDRDWFGEACDKRRQAPSVKYYCVNHHTGTRGKIPAVQVKVQTNGFETLSVYQYQEERSSGQGSYKSCPQTVNWKSDDTSGSYTLVIPYHKTRSNPGTEGPEVTHNCGTSLSRYSTVQSNEGKWKLKIQENPKLNLEHDVEILMSCDFSDSNRLLAAESFKVDASETIQANTMSLNPDTFKDDVTLDLVDYMTGQPVKDRTELGKAVFLRLEFGNKEGSPIRNILPKSCIVTTQGGKKSGRSQSADTPKLIFVDNNGCHQDKSPIPAFTGKDRHTLETGWFPLFGLGDVSLLKFQCAYRICFYEENCEVKCGGKKGRRRRAREAVRGDQGELVDPVVTRAVQTVRPLTSG